MTDLAGRLARRLDIADRACAVGRAGENVELHTSIVLRRQYPLLPQAEPTRLAVVQHAALLRLSRAGQDVFLTIDADDPQTVAGALTVGRTLLPHGRSVWDLSDLASADPLDPMALADPAAVSTAARRQRVEALRVELADVLASLPSGQPMSMLRATLREDHAVTAFASCQRRSIGQVRTSFELRCVLAAAAAGPAQPVVVSAFAGRPERLNLAALLRAGGWRATAATVPGPAAGARPSNDRLLLTPLAAAQVLQAVTQVILSRPQPALAPRPVRLPLLDDPLAADGPRSARFDQEGIACSPVSLVDRAGRVGRLVSRGSSRGAEPAAVQPTDRLTGHAVRSDYQTVPEPTPSNVRLEPSGYWPAADLDGTVGYTVDTNLQHASSGNRLSLRIATATVRAGAVRQRQPSLRVAGSPYQVLAAVVGASEVCGYAQGPEFSTAGCWLLLDLSALDPADRDPADRDPADRDPTAAEAG